MNNTNTSIDAKTTKTPRVSRQKLTGTRGDSSVALVQQSPIAPNVRYIALPKEDNSVYAIPAKEIKNSVDKEKEDPDAELLEQFNLDRNIGEYNITQTYKEFKNRTLKDIMAVLEEKFNVDIKPSSDCPGEEWVFDAVQPVTRNKVMLLLAHKMNNMMGIKFLAFDKDNDIDSNSGMVLTIIYDNLIKLSGSLYLKRYMHHLLNALVFPASIQQLGINVNDDNVFESGVVSTKVNLMDFHVDNVWHDTIQGQRFVKRSYILDKARADIIYKGNKDYEEVEGGFYRNYSRVKGYEGRMNQMDADKNKVVVEEYYNKTFMYKKKRGVMATFVNGTLIKATNLKGYYPFKKLIDEEFADTDFFYGMSRAMKMLSQQLTIDQLFNAYVNNEYLNVYTSYTYSSTDGTKVDPNQVHSPFQIIEIGNGVLNPTRAPRQSNGLMNAYQVQQSAVSEGVISENAGGATQQYVNAKQSMFAQENMNISLGYFDSQIECDLVDMGYIIMEKILQEIKIKDIKKIGGVDKFIYNSLFTEDSKGIKFEIFNHKTKMDRLEAAYQLGKLAKKKNQTLYLANPATLKDIKYKIFPSVEKKDPTTENFRKQQLLGIFQAVAPYLQQEPQVMSLLMEHLLFAGIGLPEVLLEKLKEMKNTSGNVQPQQQELNAALGANTVRSSVANDGVA